LRSRQQNKELVATLIRRVMIEYVRPEDLPNLERWANFWGACAGFNFRKEYLAVAAQGYFMPRIRSELHALLRVCLLEKAMYELGYEFNIRPAWLRISLSGIAQLLSDASIEAAPANLAIKKDQS
jgi:maltose alpha-D-glucosyltransferase/alpha-amylase